MKLFKILLLIMLIMIIIGSMVFYYYFNERPKIENAQTFSNIAILVSDELAPDRNIQVPYEIKGISTSYFKSGNTSENSAILERIPINATYIINIIPSSNEKYYSSSKEFSTYSLENQQLHLFLRKADGITLSSNTSLVSSNILNLNVKSKNNGNYDNLVFCAKWGLHIIKLLTDVNYQQINVPNLYKDYNTCYYTNNSLTYYSNEANIQFSYSKIGNLDLNDYLYLVVMDSNYINNQYITQYEEKDIGGINENFIFSY